MTVSNCNVCCSSFSVSGHLTFDDDDDDTLVWHYCNLLVYLKMCTFYFRSTDNSIAFFNNNNGYNGMLLLRLVSTIATQSILGRRRRLPTSCNECSMLPPVWSVTHGSSIAV